MLDPDRLADALVAGAKRYVDLTVRPLVERIHALETRLATAPVGMFKNESGCLILTLGNGSILETPIRDGKDGAPGRDGVDGKDGTPGRDGIDGKDGAPGQNGKDGANGNDGKDADPEAIAAAIDKALAARPPAPDRQAQLDEEIRGLIEDAIRRAFDEMEPPEPGPPGPPGRDGKDGRDGIALTAALINREGELVLTLADGSTRNVGRIVGKDGAPGAPGRDAFGFDDLSAVLAEDGRTVIIRFRRGDEIKEFPIPFDVVLDRGVWREGAQYRRGDSVTHGGSSWIAQRDTNDKPETTDAWRLAVKRGRDGKDGKPGEPPEPKKPIRVGS